MVDDAIPWSDLSYDLWVEGKVTVTPWDQAKQTSADALQHHAGLLGLTPFRTRTPERSGGNRRWSMRRVSHDDVLHLIVSTPGITPEELNDRLYKEDPWTDAKKRQSMGKLRIHLAHLRANGRVVKRFDATGQERWTATGVPSGLRLTPAGPAAPRADQRSLPEELLTHEITAAAAALQRFREATDGVRLNELNEDLYRDAVRAIWNVLKGAEL